MLDVRVLDRRSAGVGEQADEPLWRDEHGHRQIDGVELAAFVRELAGEADSSAESSARNRLRGVVRSVTVEGLLAQVELDVTEPARVVAIITRDSAEQLGLKAGEGPAEPSARHARRALKASGIKPLPTLT